MFWLVGYLVMVVIWHYSNKVGYVFAGVFPYEYLTSYDVLKEKSLPPIEAFSSYLGVGRTIAQEDYAHPQKVFGYIFLDKF